MTQAQARLQRAPVVQIIDVGDATLIRAPDGRVHELTGASAQLCRAVLSFVLTPRTRAEIDAHVEELTGAPLGSSKVIAELVGLLESAAVLIPAPPPGPRRIQASLPRARLVLGLCGAVAASLAPDLVAGLQRRGFVLRICATDSALRFVRSEALEALCHTRVHTSLWPDPTLDLPVPHIDLARWADAVLVWPATATTIARLATGNHSTLVSALALTTHAPVILVPSMNAQMFAEPAVQRNLAQLVEDGVHVVHPGSGIELADAPGERAQALGPTPPHAVVIHLLEVALRRARARVAGPPRDAAAWDALFRTRTEAELDWHVQDLDADLCAALEAERAPERASTQSLLDVGTGLGVAALAAAELGYRVVATDCSTAALERARERTLHHDSAIVWLRDDITDTRLQTAFDVVLDRGCLHVLDAEQAQAWAAAVTRLTRPGGLLLVKTHDPSEGASRRTTPFTGPTIEALLGSSFALESETKTDFPGPRASPKARLFALRRASLDIDAIA